MLLVIGRSEVHILVREPSLVTEPSRDLSQFIQANTEIAPQIMPRASPVHALQFIDLLFHHSTQYNDWN
jgi:hypothetical protein